MNTETTSTNPVRFYRTGEVYGEFSNFAPFPIALKNRQWPTTEHYFQAQKFPGTEQEEKIRLAKSPSMAARLGRNFPGLRPDWETVKEGVMREALLAKFTQHPKLKVLLLATGETILVEHTKNDSYWGDGGDGTGKNRLGHLLMELRTKLRAELTYS